MKDGTGHLISKGVVYGWSTTGDRVFIGEVIGFKDGLVVLNVLKNSKGMFDYDENGQLIEGSYGIKEYPVPKGYKTKDIKPYFLFPIYTTF